MGDVQWEILGIDDTLDKVKVLGNDLLAVVHDEHTTNVQFDRVLLFLVLEQIEWGAFGDEEKGAEFELTLDGEVLDGQVILPVVGEGLVELSVLLVGDIIWVTGPDWFGLVEFLEFGILFLGLLLLVLLLGILVDLLNLWLVGVFIVILNLLGGLGFDLALLLNMELDWVANELRVLLDDFLNFLLLQVLGLILLQKELDLGTAANGGTVIVADGERATGGRLPDVLVVVVVL